MSHLLHDVVSIQMQGGPCAALSGVSAFWESILTVRFINCSILHDKYFLVD